MNVEILNVFIILIMFISIGKVMVDFYLKNLTIEKIVIAVIIFLLGMLLLLKPELFC